MRLADAAAAALSAAGPDLAEVFAVVRRTRTRRWRADAPTADLRRDDAGLAVRVRHDGRVGLAAAGGAIDPVGLVTSARGAARVGPRFPSRFAGEPVPAGNSGVEVRVPGTSDDPSVVELARRLRDRHPEVRVTVAIVETEEARLIRTTAGATAEDVRRSAMLTAVASRAAAGEMLDVVYQVPWQAEPAAVEAALAWLDARLRWTAHDASLPSGDLPVVLTPRAFDALVAQPLARALSGPALLDRTSFLAGRPADTPTGSGLTLIDDPTRAGAPRSRRFDDEGVPTRRRPLLDHGALAGHALDLTAAERLDLPTTGSARRTWDTWPAAEPATLIVPTGATPLPDLLRRWPRALLVDELSGEWFTDSGDAGVSASAHLAFLVEGGEVVGRVHGAALGAARAALLEGEVVASAEAEWVGDRAVLPYVHAAGLTVGDMEE